MFFYQYITMYTQCLFNCQSNESETNLALVWPIQSLLRVLCQLDRTESPSVCTRHLAMKRRASRTLSQVRCVIKLRESCYLQSEKKRNISGVLLINDVWKRSREGTCHRVTENMYRAAPIKVNNRFQRQIVVKIKGSNQVQKNLSWDNTSSAQQKWSLKTGGPS